MDFVFSERIMNIKPNPADGILKQMGNAELIPFSGGNPAAESFPAEKISEISERLLRDDPVGMLQYSLTEGCPQFIDEAKAFIGRELDIDWDANELIVTSGSQQAVELVSKALLNEGDTALSEEYSFFVAQNAIRGNGGALKGIPILDDGIDIPALEELMELKPKIIYLIPNFNNPTGITMSVKKRRAAYELAREHGALIIEDDPYGCLRFRGEALPSIKSFDREGLVVYAFSFSKIMAPSMRVSCAVVPARLAAQIKKAKLISDVHTAVWGQRVCAALLSEYDMEAHIGKLRDIYGSRCRLMLDAVAESFHPDVSWTKPDGGMFMWVTLPDRVDMMEFCRAALEQNVALVPGSAFAADISKPCNSFRMCYSTATPEDIVTGSRILGKLTWEYANRNMKGED